MMDFFLLPRRFCISLLFVILIPSLSLRTDKPVPRRLEILFLGHESRHHESDKLASILLKEYFKSGINITYTTDPGVLNEATLAGYDGLVLYANHDSITPVQSASLLSFVREGKGFIPLHCASWCFRNDPAVVELIGGQFKTHKYDSFPAVIKNASHPVMEGVTSFWTKDETYVHDKISPEIEVLTERVEGNHREPYTWIRKYGKGRVFYTAYGHDENTFQNPGFLNLVKNGILWAVGEEASGRLKQFPIANPSYFDGPVPNYERRNPAPRVQESLSPQQSMSLMQVPVDFELKLFAAEPMVVNPIYINWDEKGRLWVIETVDYPNEIKDGDKGDDRIKILEDTDGDGKADKSIVFADQLNIPTSFTFVDGGIMVSCAPSFIFLKDTNGDDKADIKKEILNGWGKWDTHAQASNLRYGPDNQIWGVVGYSGFKGKVGGDSMKFSQGLYRFKADGSSMEFLSTTSNNTWGLGFSEEYDVFISTANNTHTAFYGGIPKKYYDLAGVRQSGIKKLDAHYNMRIATKNLRQVDVFGGFTAAAGHALYTARAFPEKYWNRMAFVTEPTGRLVHQVQLEQQGSGFREKGDGWNLLVSADEWAGPIQAEVGPDGAVWVTDWYDFIIQHNPTPTLERAGLQAVNGSGNAYINPLRDHERGRIYRIVPKNQGNPPRQKLDKDDVPGLVNTLSDPNMFWRITAQRLLVERGDESVIPALVRLTENTSLDGAGINATAIHALWTMHGLGAFQKGNAQAVMAARKALSHPSAGVRRTAVQVLPYSATSLNDWQQAKIFQDKDLRVRLAVVVAMAAMPGSPALYSRLSEMMTRADNLNDEWIRQAMVIAGRIHQAGIERIWSAAPAKLVDTAATRLRRDLQTAIREGYEISSTTSTYSGLRPDKTITLRVVKDVMKYDRTLLTARAGSLLRIDFQNPDFMQHNLLILKPGSLKKVGEEADKLAQDPNGTRMQYVPRMPEVIASTPLINPQGSYTLIFRVPAVAGDYPFVCTFPGHWRMMNGVLRVTK